MTIWATGPRIWPWGTIGRHSLGGLLPAPFDLGNISPIRIGTEAVHHDPWRPITETLHNQIPRRYALTGETLDTATEEWRMRPGLIFRNERQEAT